MVHAFKLVTDFDIALQLFKITERKLEMMTIIWYGGSAIIFFSL